MALERMDPQQYRWYEHGVVQEHLERYRFAAGRVNGGDVLDVACGTGYGTALLAEKAGRATGVDLAPDAVATARGRGGRATYLVGDAAALPFEPATFDRVCSFETIEHLPADLVPNALAEFARVLRPGGELIISTPDRRSYSLDGPSGNAYHPVEFTRDEFEVLLRPHFVVDGAYGQKFSRPASLGLARGVSRVAGHQLTAKAWRAYKMVIRRDAAVVDLRQRPGRVPMLVVFVCRPRAAGPAS